MACGVMNRLLIRFEIKFNPLGQSAGDMLLEPSIINPTSAGTSHTRP